MAIVIVAVEGPTAAGKTTWCQQHASAFVEEYAPTGTEPDGSDPAAQAAYWVAVNACRWRAARQLEARSGTAICDSDPLKLHHSWCLSRVGAAPWSRFERELARTRQAFADGDLGIADLVLVTIPTTAALHAHRSSDTGRRRRSFRLHSSLAAPPGDWYRAVDVLDPGRVVWELPAEGLPNLPLDPRPGRSDPDRLDELVDLLPAHGRS